MSLIWEALTEAWHLMISGDPLVYSASWRSLWITSLAICVATLISLPIGICLARCKFMFRGILVQIFRAAIALPTVFVGLLCYAMFANQGPLGNFGLLFTPWAIVIGEIILAIPIIVSLSYGAFRSLDERIGETAITLGASRPLVWLTLIREARVGISLAILTAFGRCVTELGIAMMVGGNLKSQTRTLATATAMETGQGEFARAMAMGLILLLIAMGVTFAIGLLSRDSSGDQ